MPGQVAVYAASLESLQVPIVTDADPTATPPQFALSDAGAVTPGSFVAGAWSGSWDATTGATTARTPTIGGSGSLAVTSGTTYKLWAKVALGGEVAVWPVGAVQVP